MSAIATSPLGAIRLRRRLTLEEAAARANLDVDAVKSLEDGCLYRLGSNADAVATALVYATSLGVSEREARQLAGLPVRAYVLDPSSRRRLLAVLAFGLACFAFVWFGIRPEAFSDEAPPATTVVRTALPPLPDRWEITVDVYNGTRVGNAAAQTANEVAGLAYRMGTVENAKEQNYDRTLVYYPPGAERIARRLAADLGVGLVALPGGGEPDHLVVIVGRN